MKMLRRNICLEISLKNVCEGNYFSKVASLQIIQTVILPKMELTWDFSGKALKILMPLQEIHLMKPRVYPHNLIKKDSTTEAFPHGFCRIGLFKVLGNFLRDIFAVHFLTKFQDSSQKGCFFIEGNEVLFN